MTVSATEAAFEGFRVTRRNPGAILVWAGVWLIGLVLMMAAALPFMAPWLEDIAAAEGDASALSAGARQALEYAVLASLPIGLLLQTVIMPAVYRAVLCPEDKGLAWLRVGADEARMLVVMLVLGLVSLALNFGSIKLEELAAGTLALPLRLLLSLVVFALSVYVSVRLSLIAPMTFIRRKLAFREGLRMSGRMFWPLLGMTVIVMAMAAFVILLLIFIGWPLQIAMGGGGGAQGLGALLMLFLLPIGMTLVTVILWAPFAALCRDEGPEPVG